MELQRTFKDQSIKNGMSTMNWITTILGTLYVISPVDLIPDAIPVVGWIDDILIAVSSISTVINSQLSQTNRTLSNMLKALKYISFSLFIIIALLILIFGAIIYQLIVN